MEERLLLQVLWSWRSQAIKRSQGGKSRVKEQGPRVAALSGVARHEVASDSTQPCPTPFCPSWVGGCVQVTPTPAVGMRFCSSCDCGGSRDVRQAPSSAQSGSPGDSTPTTLLCKDSMFWHEVLGGAGPGQMAFLRRTQSTLRPPTPQWPVL